MADEIQNAAEETTRTTTLDISFEKGKIIQADPFNQMVSTINSVINIVNEHDDYIDDLKKTPINNLREMEASFNKITLQKGETKKFNVYFQGTFLSEPVIFINSANSLVVIKNYEIIKNEDSDNPIGFLMTVENEADEDVSANIYYFVIANAVETKDFEEVIDNIEEEPEEPEGEEEEKEEEEEPEEKNPSTEPGAEENTEKVE